jgi:hypothetical protein
LTKKEELNTLPDTGRKRQQINPKDNFWPATARTKNAIEAWFKDLAGSKPLSSLSKKVRSDMKTAAVLETIRVYCIILVFGNMPSVLGGGGTKLGRRMLSSVSSNHSFTSNSPPTLSVRPCPPLKTVAAEMLENLQHSVCCTAEIQSPYIQPQKHYRPSASSWIRPCVVCSILSCFEEPEYVCFY